MIKFCAAALLLVTIGAARTIRAADAHKPPVNPNIIFFLVNDMGWQVAFGGNSSERRRPAGAKRGTLHSFRHFFVSTMANANVSPFKAMKIVGHSSLDIILTYYHVNEAELLGAVDGVDFGTMLAENGEVQRFQK